MEININNPWIKYLETDKKTGERKLKRGTPKKIRNAYNEYIKKLKKCANKNIPFAK